MRIIFTIIFLFFGLISFGQIKLDGIYDQEHGFRIVFRKDSLFEFYDGQAWEILGRGVFKIDSNILTLSFINHDTLNGSIQVKEWENAHDSLTLTFHIKDQLTKQALYFAVISMTDSLGKEYFKTTDNNGFAFIKLKACSLSEKPLKFNIEFRSIFYEFFRTTIYNINNQDISVGLIGQKCTIKDGTIWKYRILKIKDDKLTLKELRPFSFSRASTIFLHKIKW